MIPGYQVVERVGGKMAEQTVVVCDLEHDAPVLATTTVELPVDGQSRRVDLCAEHYAHLQSVLAEFVSPAARGRRRAPVARKRSTTKRASSGRRRGGEKADLPAGQEQIRAWAREQRLDVSDRGRLPKAIVEQYREAHQETPTE